MMLLEIELIAVAILYSVILVAVQRLLINVDRMYEIRAHMNKHQKNMMDLAKKNASKEEMAEVNAKLMQMTTESMKMQFKPMVITLPLYAVLYYLVLPNYFSAVPNIAIFSFSVSYRLAFIVVSIILTLVMQQLISFYDRRRLKDKYNFGLQPSFKEEQPAQNQ